MRLHTFPKEAINPNVLMDRCIEEIPGFRSGAYHEAIGEYMADDNHGRISWDDDYIWVETIDSIEAESIQTVINTL